MDIRTTLIAKAYAAAAAAATRMGPLLPERFHPGKRACRALRNLPDAPNGPHFARAVLLSRWRSALLQRYAIAVRPQHLCAFIDRCVEYDGASFAEPVFDGTRPVILAAPHYGAAPVGFLAAVRRMDGRRRLNLFYDTARPAPRLARLFERGGVETATLLGGFAGVVAAMRALGRKEFLVMMPDAFDDIAHTLAVPFFGRMLRVAAGTAFFAIRSGAWVVPVFAAPRARLGLRVTVGKPIDSQRFGGEEAQAIFMLTRALFASFERELRRTPEHWHNWESFPRLSTALTTPGRLEDDAPIKLLREKCNASPHLLYEIPELELLVK